MAKAKPGRKKPSDYPQMAFRISADDKFRLEKLIEDVHKTVNAQLHETDYRIKKNELIVDALWNGLLNIKKNHRRL